MRIRRFSSFAPSLLLAALVWPALAPNPARAEYHYFDDVQSGSDIVMKEVRWPYWNSGYYNTWWSQGWTSTEGISDYWYSGLALPPAGSPNPVTSQQTVNWSFWPLSNPVNITDTISSCYTSPNTYSMPTIGEGTIFRSPGKWAGWQTNVWYRIVLRTWQPVNGTPHLGYAGQWMRDGSSGIWYHMASVQFPFSVTGTSGSSGFQEDASGSHVPQRTDYRASYYRYNGAWHSSTNWHGYCHGLEMNVGALTNSVDGTNSVVYLETCNPLSPGDYSGAYTNGQSSPIFNITQPSSPPLDPIVVTNYSAAVYGNQLLVQWQVPATSSPQFAYQINVYTNASYTGTVVASAYDIAPEARQKLLTLPGVAAPYVKLSIIDIMNQTNAPVYLAAASTNLVPSVSVAGAVNGLNYAYYQSATSYTSDSQTNWSSMPNFAALAPVSSGAVPGVDLSPRQRRNGYAFNYTGYINAPSNGLYAFTVKSCDGSKLYVDGQAVIDFDGAHSPEEKSGWIPLQAGYHALNLQYFFDTQPTSMFSDYFDMLTLSWEGPGMSKAEVPVTAFYRVLGGGEPSITLTSPANGTTLSDANVPLSATVTANGNTINNVQFYNGNYFWAQDSAAPFAMNSFFWANTNNALHARLIYNTTNIIDSPVNLLTTTNLALGSWQYNQVFYHFQPNGACIQNGAYSMIGDGVNLLTRQVNGDCTLVAHLAGLPGTAAAPDGSSANSGWQAGIILRGTTNMTPGYPWGKSGAANAPFVALFGQVGGGTYYQDELMVNGGGGYSRNVTAQKWFKLARSNGTNFTSFVSADGATWTQVGFTNLTDLGSTLYAGLFTYAGPSSNPNVHWASFDNASLTGNLVGPPSVIVNPVTNAAYTGQSATFTATPSGNPPFNYQWQYSGANLPGATNATLTLTNVHPYTSGLYTVLLSNTNGSASASATLSVQTPAPATTGSLLALADAYVYGNATSSNYGSDTNLFVKTNGLSYARNAFLKFDVGALASAESVKLQLMPVSTQYTLNVGFEWVSDDTWTEAGITWNNQPARTGIIITNMPGFTVGLPVQADVTSQAVSQAGQDGLLSIRLCSTSPGSGQVLFGSRESALLANQPQLLYTLKAPAVTLASPSSGTDFAAPATISLTTSWTNMSGHTVNYVQFFSGTNLLGQVNTAAYNFSWTNVTSGNYTLYALAVYDGTNTMSSPPVFVTVNPAPNAPATISPTALSGNLIAVTWPAAANAMGYILNRNGVAIAWLAGTNYLDLGLLPNTTYAYFVVATNAYGSSPSSVTNSAITSATATALWWDAGASATGPQDGDGNWGSSANTWWNGSANVTWANGSVVIFGNGATTNCSVLVTNNVTPGNLIFNANNGGTYSFSSSGGSQLLLSGAPLILCNDDVVLNCVLGGSGQLNLSGLGTVTLTATNTYSGVTTINAGMLTIGGAGRLGSGNYAGNIANNATLNYASTAAQILSGVISGSGGLATAAGSGTVTISGANTYGGGTTVSTSGDVTALTVANNTALGTGAVLYTGKNHYSAGIAINSGLTVTNSMTLKPAGDRAVVSLAAGSQLSTGTLTVDGSAGTGDAIIITTATSVSPAIVAQNISHANGGANAFDLRGSGGYGKFTGNFFYGTAIVSLLDTTSWEFSGSSNSYGTLNINNASATLYCGAANTLSAAGVVLDGNAGGTLKLNNLAGAAAYDQTIAGLSQSVKVTTTTGTPSLSLVNTNATVNYTNTGVISGTLSLLKDGAFTQTLTASNTYSGSTAVNGGALAVTAPGGLGRGNVVVADNATLTLGTNGAGAITSGYLSSTNNLVLGSSAVANLNFIGTNTIKGLSLDGGASYVPLGTYGSSSSVAANKSSIFNGTGVINVTATPSVAMLTLASSANPSTLGQPVTFTNKVSGSGGTPTGTVTFKDAGQMLGTVGLVSGVATYSSSSLSLGGHSITASYSGDSVYVPGVSSVLMQQVNPATPVINGGILWTGNGVQFSFSGPSGQTYKVLGSTNVTLPISNWLTLTNGTFGAGPATFTDSAATNNVGFYRVVSP